MSTEHKPWMSVPCTRLFVEPYSMGRIGPVYLRLRGVPFRAEDSIDTFELHGNCYYLMADRRTIVCVSLTGNGMILELDDAVAVG